MKNIINLTMNNGADKAEAYFVKHYLDEIIFEDSLLKQVSSKKLHGLSLKAVKDDKVGSIATSDLTDLDSHAKKVVEFAGYGDKLTFDFVQPGANYPELDLTNEEYFAPSIEDLVSEGETVLKKILSYDKNIKVTLNIQRRKETKEIHNSYGLNLAADKYESILQGSALLVEGDNFINIGDVYLPQGGRINFTKFADDLIERMKISRKTVTMESGRYPVIFTPSAVNQMTLALQGFKGQLVAKGVSPLKEKMNTQIFHEMITLIDDGIMPDGFGSHKFDDEGTPMQKTVLVEDGILKNFIFSLESAAEMNKIPTGNGIKMNNNYSSKMEENFTNLIFKPGKVSLEEMIQEIKLGLLIDDISGLMMGNLYQGNIDSDMEMAYKIENGEVVGRVKNGALGTNIYKVWKDNLVAIENKLTPVVFASPVYAPHILCKDIYVTIA